MGEGVSLPLSRNGFPVANHLGVVPVPFAREHGLSGSFNLSDFPEEEGDSRRVAQVRSDNLLCYEVPVSKVHVPYGGSFMPIQGFGGLTSRGHPLQNRVSLPHKGKVIEGDQLSSRFCGATNADSVLPKKRSSHADAVYDEEVRCAVDAESVGPVADCIAGAVASDPHGSASPVSGLSRSEDINTICHIPLL